MTFVTFVTLNIYIFVTHFRPIPPFLHPQYSLYTPRKHQKTFGFSDGFRGYRKRTLAGNELTNRKYVKNQ